MIVQMIWQGSFFISVSREGDLNIRRYMMAVQVIKATKHIPGMSAENNRTGEKMKVAAYCRVSTGSEEQETSYEAQCRHYTDFINSNPRWKLAGIYADEGISGTSTRHREQFNQMIADCEDGQIDMVITKSISRWARNTIDSLKNIRRLKSLGVPVLFEKENINTMDVKGEVLITIMSSIAQQESESISRNVRMGIQYIFQQGKPRLNTTQFTGLQKGKDGKSLVIIPEEAALVRRIFREYLEGCSPNMIAARLMKDKILSPAGKEKWYQSTIDSMLRNEKYCGDLLLQKYYVVDVLSHRIAKNEGQLPQYFVEDAHEPIIPKEVFYQVQGELQRRSHLKNDPNKIRYGSSMALTGRLVCGKCGRILKRYINPDPMQTDWRCRKRAYEKKSITKEVEAKCDCRNAKEKEVQAAIVAAFNELPGFRDEVLRAQGAIRDGDLKCLDMMIERMQEQQSRLNERLNGLADPGSAEAAFLAEELNGIEEERMSLMLERADAAHREIRIRILLELIDMMKEKHDESCGIISAREEESGEAACYDYDEFFRRTRVCLDDGVLNDEGKITGFYNDMVIRYLDTVTVLDEGYEVNFKAGLTVKVNAVQLRQVLRQFC